MQALRWVAIAASGGTFLKRPVGNVTLVEGLAWGHQAAPRAKPLGGG